MNMPLRKPYPVQMIIDIHSYCNAQCSICPYPNIKNKIPMGMMNDKLFIKIIDDYSNISKKYDFKGSIIFCNMGELFCHADVAFDRMKYVIQSGLNFSIQTNASLLTPDIADRLKQVGFNGTILISCHGITADVYKRIMGLDLQRTLSNIEYLVKVYPREKIVVASIPHIWPRGESWRIRKYFRRIGIKVRMALPNNRAGLVTWMDIRNKHKLVACKSHRPLGEMVVSFNGNVVLCCNDMAQKEIVGNLSSQSIEEVWNGCLMMDKLEKIYCGKMSDDDFICKQCEFGITSLSLMKRFYRNIRHECKKFFLTRIW